MEDISKVYLPTPENSSQFPFWDFFCCNEAMRWSSSSTTASSLNSLFGISFVVTFTFAWDGNLISFSSQFPFWDFFCCNWGGLDALKVFWASRRSQFPFWDFFCCNFRKSPFLAFALDQISQFPFWDFFCCNLQVITTWKRPHRKIPNSQFPFWDFFCCNAPLPKQAKDCGLPI